MRPLIGLSCSTLISSEHDRLGMKRYAIPAFYVARVEEAGGLPVLLPTAVPERASEVLQRLDALLLSGGADLDPDLYGQPPHPRLGEVDRPRDLYEIALVKAARRAGLPILAICRGMQVVNVAYGGTLIQDLPSQRKEAAQHEQVTVDITQTGHAVRIEPGTQFHALAGSEQARVNSYHHQAVDRMAEGFRATAYAPDGVLEAMEHPEGPFFQCVQWHPERLAGDPVSRGLFEAFIRAARPLATAQAPSAGERPVSPPAAAPVAARRGSKPAAR